MKPKQFLRPVMLAGTGSDVGKSVLATALCRIFRQDGFTPAPFKAQNMALNSAVTREGGEMGRAQAVQAEAAGVEPHTDMNPVLLKPSSDSTSQVIVGGRAVGNRNAWEYFRGEGRELLRAEAHAAFDRVASRFNPVVLEGAGSITELNLREGDIVNMSMARYADAAVVLVADIDRGGVFASLYGSVVLQTPEDRARIRGIIVNKFRGDMRLFDDGRRMIEELCGVPVLGVVPYFTGIAIEAEDSVVLAGKRFRAEVGSGRVNIAVVALGRISNFTDFDTLERDGRVHLYYTAEPEELLRANIIVVPGSKSTLDDLDRLWRSGAAQAIVQAWQGGATVLGICGGYQMLGREVRDPEGVEGGLSEVAGLGLLPVSTVMSGDKVVRQRRFRLSGSGGGLECSGYEIHNGRTEVGGGEALAVLDDGVPEGCRVQGASGVSGSAMGTYLHGILDNAPFIEMLLAPFSGGLSGELLGGLSGELLEGLAAASVTDETPDNETFKQRQYDLLADHVRRHVDMARLYEILRLP